MDAGTSSPYQDIMLNYGDYLFGTQLQNSKITGVEDVQASFKGTCVGDVAASSNVTNLSYGVSYSQGKAFSYTEMLFGFEMSAERGYNKDSLQGPMGEENKMFMITRRYSNGNDTMEVDEDQFDQPQQNSMESEDMMYEEDASTMHFDSSNAKNSDGEWDEPSPKEYDIFGDLQENPSVDKPRNARTHEQPPTSDEYPASAPAEEVHAENEEPVEILSQEDIEDFLERDNVETCSQEVRRQHTPHLDMMFDSDEEAYRFYNEYAAICGFSVKKAGNYHGKMEGSTGHTRATFLCNRSGKIVDEGTMELRKKRR